MVKKALAWVITVAAVISLNLFVPVTARAGSGTYFINDDFESGIPGQRPAGWVSEYWGEWVSVVDSVYKNGNNSFKLDGKPSGAAGFYKSIAGEMPDNITVEAYIQPASTGESGSISLYNTKSSGAQSYLARVVFEGEKISYSTTGHDNNNLINLQSYTAGTWYHVKITHDLVTRKYDVYIDGVIKASNVDMYTDGAPDSLMLASGNDGGDNIVYFDDVKVYSGYETPVLSSDATLSDLTVDGTTVPGFDPGVLSYDVELPAGTTGVPTVTAAVYDENATAEITPAENLPGTTTVVVTAEDGSTTKTYNISFTFAEGDTTAPTLTAGEVNRTSDTEAIVKFTSNEEGEYYYAVVADGAGEPVIDTGGTGTACDTTKQTIGLDSLSAGAKDIYIKVKDEADNISEALKMDIPAYVAPISNAEMVAADKAALTWESIRNANTDQDSVTGNLNFIVTGEVYSSTISWSSSDSSTLTVSGQVYRPSYSEGDKEVTLTATITKGDASDTKTFNLTVTKLPPSGNANLAALTATGISLTPEFSSATENYSAGVGHDTNSTTITATPADNTATVTINGTPGSSSTVDLSAGSNTVTIEVTAQDGITQKTYTLNITRSGGGSSGGGGDGGSGRPATNEVSKFISATDGGEISMEGITVNVPGGSISDDGSFSIKKLSAGEQNSVVSSGMRFKLCGDVYEIETTGDRDFGDNTITIKIAYEPEDIGEEDQPVIHYYDEENGEWIAVETTTEYDEETDRYYAVTTVNHLTKFAVFGTETEAIAARTIKLTIGKTSALVGGKPYTMDALPYLDEQAGRTLVPVRFVSEALGAGVEWNANDRTVTVTDTGRTVILTLGSQKVRIGGLEQSIDCAPRILPPGRTFVPLRFVSETLGAKVDYKSSTGADHYNQVVCSEMCSNHPVKKRIPI